MTIRLSFDDPDNFSGAGAGSISISDKIVGIRGFNADLIVFVKIVFTNINIDDTTTGAGFIIC